MIVNESRNKLRNYHIAVCFLIGLGALVAVLLTGQNNAHYLIAQETPSNIGNWSARMTNFVRQRRYEDAIKTGLDSIKNEPSDGFIFQQIAIVYLIRAQKDSHQREHWVSKSAEYIEKSLSVGAEDIAGLDYYTAGRSYEMAGDLSATQRCLYYKRAEKSLEDQGPLLQGNQLTIGGETFQIAPLRKEAETTLMRIRKKLTHASCR